MQKPFHCHIAIFASLQGRKTPVVRKNNFPNNKKSVYLFSELIFSELRLIKSLLTLLTLSKENFKLLRKLINFSRTSRTDSMKNTTAVISIIYKLISTHYVTSCDVMAVWNVDRQFPIDLIETTLSLECFVLSLQILNFINWRISRNGNIKAEWIALWTWYLLLFSMKADAIERRNKHNGAWSHKSFSKILEIVSIFCLLSFNILKEIKSFLIFESRVLWFSSKKSRTRAILLWMTFSFRLSHS